MKTAITILILLLTVISFAIWTIRPINRQPITDSRFYKATIHTLDTLHMASYPSERRLRFGWSRQNIMPGFITPMAGYKLRDHYESVHDSLFVNCIVIDNGNATVALLSFDLLIVPPLLKEKIENEIKDKSLPVQFAYYSASHTHNGIGGWDNSTGGQLMTGDFDQKILDHLIRQTTVAIESALAHLESGKIYYDEVNAEAFVRNRLNFNSSKDGSLKRIEFLTESGKKGALVSFSAHATNINSKSRTISNDYPGRLRKQLESEKYDFVMFMAGTVGSHSTDYKESGEGFDYIDNYTNDLTKTILADTGQILVGDSLTLKFGIIPVELGPSQMRISDNLRLSSSIFNDLFSRLNGNIRYLKIGQLVLLGMPCDFSGEILVENNLYDLASQNDEELMITSFNGQYIGYITEDHHYDTSRRSEVRNMNWIGPNFGAYYSEIVKKVIEKF